MATPQESPSRLEKAGTTTAIIWVALSTWRSWPTVPCSSRTISSRHSIASGTTAGEFLTWARGAPGPGAIMLSATQHLQGKTVILTGLRMTRLALCLFAPVYLLAASGGEAGDLKGGRGKALISPGCPGL